MSHFNIPQAPSPNPNPETLNPGPYTQTSQTSSLDSTYTEGNKTSRTSSRAGPNPHQRETREGYSDSWNEERVASSGWKWEGLRGGRSDEGDALTSQGHGR